MKPLFDYLSGFYRPDEFPALAAQMERWRTERPFAGRKLLDGTPVFRNTLVKYLALLEGGAELTVSAGAGIPADPEVLQLLPRFGVRVADDAARRDCYDVVMDCAGAHRGTPARYGRVELTRSGLEYYRNFLDPVFSADSGRIKVIETGLGTGDGFQRGMEQLGFLEFAGRRVVIFGCGKVGTGVAVHALWLGAEVVVVDDSARVTPPAGATIVDLGDRAGIDRALRGAWCMVSCTGLRGALEGKFDAAALVASPTLIVNMGVEDEFGSAIPAERVLNGKRPLNFILEEPTRLCYIDPTMALDNAGALEVLEGKLPPGISLPPAALEAEILETVRRRGRIAPELEKMEGFFA